MGVNELIQELKLRAETLERHEADESFLAGFKEAINVMETEIELEDKLTGIFGNI